MFLGLSLFEALECLIFLGALTAAVSFELSIAPLIVLCVIFLLGYFINHWDVVAGFHWIANNQVLSFMTVLGYIVAGIVWSTIKWKIRLRDLSTIADEILAKTSSTADFKYTFVNRTAYEWPVKASQSKDHILTWLVYWPLSIPITVCSDWFVRLWNQLYEFLSSLYQSMADKEMQSSAAKLDQLRYQEKVAATMPADRKV